VLQRNPNIRKLKLDGVPFNHAIAGAGIVSFLEGAPALTDVSLDDCSANSSDTTQSIATALQRNNRIQTLDLQMYVGDFLCRFLCTLFQGLASSDSVSRLQKLSFGQPHHFVLEKRDRERIAEALGKYLESAHATVHHLELRHSMFHRDATHIFRGLNRNTSVTELKFVAFLILEAEADDEMQEAEADDEMQEFKQELVNFFRSMNGLRTLRIGRECDLFFQEAVWSAVAENLVRRESTLRFLEFCVDNDMPLPAFQSLMTAASRCVQLQGLSVNFDSDPRDDSFGDALFEGLPSFKITHLELQLLPDQKEGLLRTHKNNYIFQSFHCTFNLRDSFALDIFDEADKALLEIYLNRNRRLAQWTKNPKLVPRELWSYALNLAVKAGINPLFQSLLALSGQDVGLRKQGRQRKRPRRYDPSS